MGSFKLDLTPICFGNNHTASASTTTPPHDVPKNWTKMKLASVFKTFTFVLCLFLINAPTPTRGAFHLHQAAYQAQQYLKKRCQIISERLKNLETKALDVDDEVLYVGEPSGHEDFTCSGGAVIHSNRCLRFTVDLMNARNNYLWCQALEAMIRNAVDQIRDVEACSTDVYAPYVAIGSSDRFDTVRNVLGDQLVAIGKDYFR